MQIHSCTTTSTARLLPLYIHALARLKCYGRVSERSSVTYFHTTNPILLILHMRGTTSELLMYITSSSSGYFYETQEKILWSQGSDSLPKSPEIKIDYAKLLKDYCSLDFPPQRVSLIFDTPKPPISRTGRSKWSSEGLITRSHYRLESLMEVIPYSDTYSDTESISPKSYLHHFSSSQDPLSHSVMPIDLLNLDIYAVIEQLERRTS